MKKLMTLCLAIFSTIIFIVGCSNTNNEPSISNENTTRIVSTVMGDIKVPVNPERVVVNWYIGDVFALGLNVVGHNAWEQDTMPFYDKFASSTKIENWEPEEVMSLKPDLIITYSEDDFEKFKKIAPVLVIPELNINSLERVKIIGEATGQKAEAEAAVTKFETKLEDAKKTFNSGDFEGKTFSIMEDWGPYGD